MNGLRAAVGYGELWLFITLNRNRGALKSMNNDCNMKPIALTRRQPSLAKAQPNSQR